MMRRMKNWVPALLVLLMCMAISVGTYAVYGQYNLDSDIASEFVLAQLLNEEGRLMTDSWFYSTELRVVSPVPVYQLMLMLCEDWHVARTASIAVLLAGVAASLVYMVRGMGASYTSALLCAAAVVLPITEYNSFTLVYGGFYTVCVMLTFVEIGLVLRMGKRKGLKRLLAPLLLALLGVYGGMGGVRMLMVCIAPLAAACFVTFFIEVRTCDHIHDLFALPSFPMLAGGVLLTAATLVGYKINTGVFAQMYDFAQYGETTVKPLTAEMFTDQIICLMSYFGYRNHELLLSLEGVVSVLAVILPVAGAAAMALMLQMKLDVRERLLAVFMPFALLLGMAINVLTLTGDESSTLAYTVSYYMPAAILLVYALFWVFDRFACRMKWVRVVPMLAIVGVFLAGNMVYRDKEFKTYPTELEDIAWCLMDEWAYEGYATFWNANVLTEITGGEIEVFAVEEWKNGTINEWLQRKDHLDRRPEGTVFALFRARDWKEGEPGFDSDRLVYASDEFYVVVYDSDEEFRQAIGWAM